MSRRHWPHMDSLHPAYVSDSGVQAPSIADIAAARRGIVVGDRRTWDWTSDGSCEDPFWLAHQLMLQRRRVIQIPFYGDSPGTIEKIAAKWGITIPRPSSSALGGEES